MAVEAVEAPALEVARREHYRIHFGGVPSAWCASVPGVHPYLVCARTWCVPARWLSPYLVCARARLGLVGA